MEDHHILPTNPREITLIEDRILKFSTTVVTVADWTNLMAAGEAVLPRREGRRLPASNLDLVKLSSEPQMHLFGAILRAVGAPDTFRTNRRYSLLEWAGIVRRFSELSLYTLPPAPLGYAVDLCRSAISAASRRNPSRS